MMSGAAPYFASTSEGIHQPNQLYPDVAATSSGAGPPIGPNTHIGALLCSLSILKEKVNQVQSLVSIYLSSENNQVQPVLPSMGTLIQEIVVTASSMMFNCQQMALSSSPGGGNFNNNNNNNNHDDMDNIGHDDMQHKQQLSNIGLSQMSTGNGVTVRSTSTQGLFDSDSLYNWYADNSTSCYNSNNNNNNNNNIVSNNDCKSTRSTNVKGKSKNPPRQEGVYDIVELDAADLLAKYTHYCQVCGKGFKRDANLRMHMRAHGDEYKSSAALSNPSKNSNNNNENKEGQDGLTIRKYSCPQVGCRWNKNHARFQPLKSMICVKNHYRRSHCPKMYVCKRCNRKQFSVLSDLRTHEKHCGDMKWRCSCGTTFSRKDKLMGHVALFVGHVPMNVHPGGCNKVESEQHSLQIQFELR